MAKIVEVRISEVKDGYLPVEVWLGSSKAADDEGQTMKKVVDVKVPIELPIKS